MDQQRDTPGAPRRGSAVLRRARHAAGHRRRCAARGPTGDRGGHPSGRPGRRRRIPRLAGPTSHWRRASSPGSAGTELFRPVEGVQEEWTALYRYETADDLDRWLTSDERKQLLAEGEKFSDFHARTIDNSFGSWFAFDEHGAEAPPPSNFKTADCGLGRAVPHCRIDRSGLWPLKYAAVARPADRKSVVQLRHELPR